MPRLVTSTMVPPPASANSRASDAASRSSCRRRTSRLTYLRLWIHPSRSMVIGTSTHSASVAVAGGSA